MILHEGPLFLWFAAISLLSASVAVVLTGYLQVTLRRRQAADLPQISPIDPVGFVPPPVAAPIHYAFLEGKLVSDVPANDPFLAPGIDRRYAPTALSSAMASLHPDLPDRIADLLARGEPFCRVGYLGADAISVSGFVQQGRLVVTVSPAMIGENELLERVGRQWAVLRHAQKLTSDLQWTETLDGRVLWCNSAYLKLCTEFGALAADGPTWPLPRVFGDQLASPPSEGKQRRCRVTRAEPDVTRWFEAEATRISDSETLYGARHIDRLVQAEDSLRDFVQTLSKIFATLPVGLVVFDRKRELVLFNPALVSLSTLDPGFLTRRPSLRSFLDQLREFQRMPEPRDYRSWRDEFAALEQDAEADQYHEIWNLPHGETLRVTGKPHPNGAIAFLFEDISQEVSLTRRFRSDIELDHVILDALPAALVVFGRDGEVLRTNSAYDRLLSGHKQGKAERITSLETMPATLSDTVPVWQHLFQPSGLWGEIKQFVSHDIDRAAWSDAVKATNGEQLHCRVAPLKGGNTIVWFLTVDVDWIDLLSEGTWFGPTNGASHAADLHPTVATALEVETHGEGAA